MLLTVPSEIFPLPLYWKIYHSKIIIKLFIEGKFLMKDSLVNVLWKTFKTNHWKVLKA